MKLIALIVALGIERLATRLLQLRELRWFDPYFDLAVRVASRASGVLRWLVVAAFVALLLLPVWLVSRALLGDDAGWDLDYLLFAVLVLFFCLGPRDLGSEVERYRAALDRGDEEEARRVLTAMAESEQPHGRGIDVVEEAVFVQATNRIFAVVLWFVVLGPVGAWLFRVNDLFRRRLAFEVSRGVEGVEPVVAAVDALHGVLVWVPARLAALGYALGGGFDEAMQAWRNLRRPDEERSDREPFWRTSERLVASVGKAAMAGVLAQPSNSSAAAKNALTLVRRTLFIWITVVAALTVTGWAV
ncbi:MAG TPA: regulatory signaling modulator protein AmpE [Gammaproteobacteria bacterium]